MTLCKQWLGVAALCILLNAPALADPLVDPPVPQGAVKGSPAFNLSTGGAHDFVTYGGPFGVTVGLVPEPDTIALFALGLLAICVVAWAARRRRGRPPDPPER